MSKRVARFMKDITVEPATTLYVAVYLILDLTTTNFMLQKVCRLNATSEPSLYTPCDDERKGIVFASKINSTYRTVMFFSCKIITVFAMCWSDEAGRRRRPLIYLPILGLILHSVTGCVHSYFWTWQPETAALLFAILEISTGGGSLMTIAYQTYVCDVSDADNRTMRLGIFLTFKTLGNLLGFGVAGFILRRVGFFYTYLICVLVSVVTLLLALIFVKDVSVPVDKKASIWKFFNFSRISDSFGVVFKKSLGRNRIVVFMLMLIFMLVFFTTQGEKDILYLFLRHKFKWNEQQFSIYVIYRYTGIIIGSIFCSMVLSKWLKIHDGLIGILSGTMDTVVAVGYLFANQDWHLYVVPIFDIFHGTAQTVSVSFYSKYYDTSEFGRLNSVLGIFALIMPISRPSYNGIFQKTLDFFPSAFFLLSIVLDILIVLLYCASYFYSKKTEKQKPIFKEGQPMIARFNENHVVESKNSNFSS